MQGRSLQATFVTLPFSWLLIRLCQWEVVAGDGVAGRQGRDLFLLPDRMCMSATAADISGAIARKCVLVWKDQP